MVVAPVQPLLLDLPALGRGIVLELATSDDQLGRVDIIGAHYAVAVVVSVQRLDVDHRVIGSTFLGLRSKRYPSFGSLTAGEAPTRPFTILSSSWPTRPSASPWSSCLPTQRFKISAKKSAAHGAFLAYMMPSSARRPWIDRARTALSPRVGNCSRVT